MRPPTTRRLAWTTWTLIVACWLGYYGLWIVGGLGPFGPVLNEDQFARGEPVVMLAWCVSMIGAASIAALIVSRHPRHPVGWLLFLPVTMVSVFTFAGQYGVMPLRRPDLPWPAAVWLV